MINNKPTILCTRALVETRSSVNQAYSSAVENSGGVLLMLAGNPSHEDIYDLVKQVDGILLTGGTDVNPALYEEEKKEYTADSDNERDILESEIIECAMENKLPILGICRGIQILNVKLGGSLFQDIEKELNNVTMHDRHNDGPRNMLAHQVTLKKDSVIEKIVGKENIEVNSLHHQGIKTVSPMLVASGVSPDGLVEAVEMPNHPFLVAVQWHPEELTTNPEAKNIFDSFIVACKK